MYLLIRNQAIESLRLEGKEHATIEEVLRHLSSTHIDVAQAQEPPPEATTSTPPASTGARFVFGSSGPSSSERRRGRGGSRRKGAATPAPELPDFSFHCSPADQRMCYWGYVCLFDGWMIYLSVID